MALLPGRTDMYLHRVLVHFPWRFSRLPFLTRFDAARAAAAVPRSPPAAPSTTPTASSTRRTRFKAKSPVTFASREPFERGAINKGRKPSRQVATVIPSPHRCQRLRTGLDPIARLSSALTTALLVGGTAGSRPSWRLRGRRNLCVPDARDPELATAGRRLTRPRLTVSGPSHTSLLRSRKFTVS